MRQLFASVACVAVLAACQTRVTDAPSAELGVTAEPPRPVEPQGPNPQTDAAPRAYPLGKLEDSAVRQLLYDELARRVSHVEDVGDGRQETSELGEAESFEFNIIKIMRDGVEINGNEAPNRLDIEVRGWYRRSASGGTEVCSSFDTAATVVYRGHAWVLDDGQDLAFTREDQEDCY